MWFNDIDIVLRYPSWPQPSQSVAPGRHWVARDRYLERKAQCEMVLREREFEARLGAVNTWLAALAARLGRQAIGAKALSWRGALPGSRFR